MTELKVLIRETFRPVDSRRSSTISIDKVATLNHEILDHPMKLASFVALRSTKVVFRLACAILTKILCGSWYNVGEQLHFDTPQRLTAESHVEEDDWIWLSGHFDAPFCVYICWSG